MTESKTVRYELLDEGKIARVTLNRPEVRNAQSRRMTYDLDDAFSAAAFDEAVKVIILAGEGPHFSSGHDLRDREEFEMPFRHLVGSTSKPGAEGYYAHEEEVYLRMCRRWHDLPKPTIAQVHGKTIAGGLMLMWVCDLIVATEDATFQDLTVNLGVNGVEWFSHPWELGIRKAKEMLFTGEPVTAAEAYNLGMLNHVVPADQLTDFTLELARKIAAKPSWPLRLAKVGINQTLDAQGFWTAQQANFSLQHLGHTSSREDMLRQMLAKAQAEAAAAANGGSEPAGVTTTTTR